MNGKKLSRLLILLAVLVGVFLVVKFTGNKGRSKSFRSELVEFDAENVSKIELLSITDTTVLTKEESQWKVDGKYFADKSSVTAMLENLKRIKPSRIASRKEDSWKDYQVDDAGLRVVVYEGGDKATDIILGRFQMEGQRSYSSYVRLAEDNDTYVAKDFMKMSISQGSEAYRDDDVLRVDKDSVQSVSFSYPDSAFVLEEGVSGWEAGGMIADSAAVAKYFQGLKFVNSRKFIDEINTPAQFDATFNLKNGEQVIVSNYGYDQISSSTNENEQWQDPAAAKKVFKGPSYFVPLSEQ